MKCRSENPGARFKILEYSPPKNVEKNQPAPSSAYGKNFQRAEQKS